VTLQLSNIAAGYNRSPVVNEIELTINTGEIVTLLGANGSGKSTLVKTISGLLSPMHGGITFNGERIDQFSPAQRLRLGISHVPEGRQVFAGMTAAENLHLGAYIGRDGHGESERVREVCNLFPILRERMHQVVGNFSGGQQQMLAIARGLMSGPRLLLLDEPSLGLAPLLVAKIFRLIKNLRQQGLSILLAEQNARAALAIADRGYVIENGRVAFCGSAQDLLNSSEIANRYLGVSESTDISSDESARLAERLRKCIL
jgi:branched-chain amino acid transport system ATP-binding protein